MEELTCIKSYRFEANADFAQDILQKEGIKCKVAKATHRGEPMFEVKADPAYSAKAFSLLNNLDLDESPVKVKPDNFMKDEIPIIKGSGYIKVFFTLAFLTATVIIIIQLTTNIDMIPKVTSGHSRGTGVLFVFLMIGIYYLMLLISKIVVRKNRKQ